MHAIQFRYFEPTVDKPGEVATMLAMVPANPITAPASQTVCALTYIHSKAMRKQFNFSPASACSEHSGS